jgi:hypothetical protein
LVQSEGKQIGDMSPIVPSVCGKTKTFNSLEESWEIKLGPLSRKAGRLNLALALKESWETKLGPLYAFDDCVRKGYQ